MGIESKGSLVDVGEFFAPPPGYLALDVPSQRWGLSADALSGLLGFDGYQTFCGDGWPVMFEWQFGELRLVVWGDVNAEEPTHVISLEGARESLRDDVDV